MLVCHLDVGEIKSRRAKLRWSQAELADRAGVSVGTISKLEEGGELKMQVLTLFKITDALQIPREDFHKLFVS